MDPTNYPSSEFGRALREPGNRWAFWHFVPAHVPREIAMTAATIRALSDADASLGRLHGLGALIRDPQLLLGPYLRREAVASSRIEGTQASLSDLLRAEANGSAEPDEDIAEVGRYIAATHQGYGLIDGLPITQRMILKLHATLMSGVRGQERSPGEFRRTPVWVGSADDTPESAAYVPPLPGELAELISDWERFVNEPSDLPILAQCALMHYQFETIHPFLDGNGRIGRLLINLLLMDQQRLGTPLLYVSGYLEQHRRQYYERLQGVRERGEIQEWMQFFFVAVRRSADDAVKRAEQLVDLRERYLSESRTKRTTSLHLLAEMLFQNPFTTVARVQSATELTAQGARNVVKAAVDLGWLSEVGSSGRGGRIYWVSKEVLDIMDAPWDYSHERF